jgi:hypothetical protein
MQGQSKKLLWPEASSQKKKLVGTNKLNFYFLPYIYFIFLKKLYNFFLLRNLGAGGGGNGPPSLSTCAILN